MAVSRRLGINRPRPGGPRYSGGAQGLARSAAPRAKRGSVSSSISKLNGASLSSSIGDKLASAPAPAPAPAAPKTSPWSALYESRIARAQGTIDAAEPVLKRQETDLSAEFGYGYDAAGNVVDDASNPFSRALQLKEAFHNRTKGTSGAAAAAGQLYSGALQRKQQDNTTSFLRDEDANKRAFGSAWNALQERRLQVKQNADDEIQQAAHDKLYDDLNNTPEDPGVDPATPEPGDPWAALMKQHSKGRWDKKVNADGSRNYRGSNGKLYRFFPDGRRVAA